MDQTQQDLINEIGRLSATHTSDRSFTPAICPLLGQLLESISTSAPDKKDDLLRWLSLYRWKDNKLPANVNRSAFADTLAKWREGQPLPTEINDHEGLERFRRGKTEGQRVTFNNFENFLNDLSPIFETVTTVLKDDSLKKKLEASIGVIRERKVRVVITALMKAGKSTFLNSLIGEDLLPSETFAATASITQIMHHSRQRPPKGFKSNWKSWLQDGDKRLEGAEISAHLKKLNDKARSVLKSSDASKGVKLPVVTIHTCLPFLDGEDFDSVEGVECELYDTPGVDEAGIANLDKRIEENIQTADVLVYLLDCQKIGSEADSAYLKNWFKLRPEFTDISTRSDCCLFIGNKIDATSCNPEEMMTRMHEFVEAAVNGGRPSAEPRFQRSQFVVCSAQHAFLCRTYKNKSMTESGKALWSHQIEKYYGKKTGKEDKLIMRLSNHHFAQVEKSLSYLIWNQRLSVTLETHVQHISNATLHAWNQLKTVLNSIEHKEEAEKRFREAEPIMAEIRRKLVTKLAALMDDYVKRVSHFIRAEIKKWKADNMKYLDSCGIEGKMTASSQEPLRKLIQNYHEETSQRVSKGRELMQSNLRSLIKQLQTFVSEAVKAELQEVYKYLHQSIENVLASHLAPLLLYLDAELPELNELDTPVNGYVELISREVKGEPQKRSVVKTKVVPGCIGSRTEEYNDIEIVPTTTQEEFYQLSLDRFKQTWADHIEKSSKSMYTQCVENMKIRRKGIQEQAVKSIDTYMLNYREAMNPAKHDHAEIGHVTQAILDLEPFCAKIADIVDAINQNNRKVAGQPQIASPTVSVSDAGLKVENVVSDVGPKVENVVPDAGPKVENLVQDVKDVNLAGAPVPPPQPVAGQKPRWVEKVPHVETRKVVFHNHDKTDVMDALKRQVLMRRPSIASADISDGTEKWEDE